MNAQNNGDELRARLVEDLQSDEGAEALAPIVQQLREWSAPEATREETAQLIARLERELPNRPSAIANLQSFWPWLLLRSQLRVVRRELWTASALVMALGTLVTVSVVDPSAPDAVLPIVFFAPLVAALGIAFLYGPDVDPALEIELAAPLSTRVVLLARLVLVSGFNLLLGLIASFALVAITPALSFWPLVTTWLAPMAFLSALAFLLTMWSTDPSLGVLISLGLWMLQALRQTPGLHSIFWYVPNIWSPEARVWLWIAAAALGLIALHLGGREERWIAKSQ
jgi:hypothetical protein